MKKIFIVISFLLLATLLVACKEKKPSKKPIVLDPKEEVSIYIDGESSVRAGKSLTLKSVVKGTDNKRLNGRLLVINLEQVLMMKEKLILL